MVPEAGDGRWCQVQRCSVIFSVLSCQSLRDLYFVLYDMNETRIIMKKNVQTYTARLDLSIYIEQVSPRRDRSL